VNTARNVDDSDDNLFDFHSISPIADGNSTTLQPADHLIKIKEEPPN